MKRLIAIGDIHGHLSKLDHLLSQVQPTDQDQLVFLGDYIDRGPQSKQVIDALIDLQMEYPKTVFLRGNHEQLFLDALINCGAIEGERLEEMSLSWAQKMRRDTDVACFKRNGGDKTLKSYAVEVVRDNSEEHTLCPKYIMLGEIPQTHIEFLQATQYYFKTPGYIFVHAGVDFRKDKLEEQEIHTLLWDRSLDGWNHDERALVIGHTPVASEDNHPLVTGDLIMLDTGAAYGRALSAMDLLTGEIWQSDHKRGKGQQTL
ncbi:serine/threonine protein phosphatase 1 [Desulfuromusa kysingii]|uniref:Serine/threonine protein phosphatase 1 n=1 Tax=Desulfuromusa kysingii TaxID=37625 RepID=A0A1H3YXN8_9BACT|nr:serine/threonine protein phosphatase [Desulfuromusa kysingii]SEA16226.1 serine/threonine protein phosphatase 1 [Desulfuromusa kysingii]